MWTGLRVSLSEFAGWVEREVGVADGVGVTVVVGGESVFAGVNTFTGVLDTLQYGVGEGPCLSAVAVGTAVGSSTIGAGERRWSRFTPRAARLGLRSAASAPVRSDGPSAAVIGSLNLYGRTPEAFDTLDGATLEGVAAALRARVSSAQVLATAAANSRALRAAARDGRHPAAP